MAQGNRQAAEFSRLVPRDRLMEGESLHEIEATPAERRALAERFELLSLDRLEARLRLRPQGGPLEDGLVGLSGHFEADVVQACVVSLEPVRSRLAEDFEVLYSLAAEHRDDQAEDGPGKGEVVFSPDEEEPPEPVGPRGLDLGEAVAQQLAVALDPYPRAPGAALESAAWPPRSKPGQEPDRDAESGTEEGPFAALKRLKRGG